MGAAVLASKACLRAGVGLCVSYVPKCGYEILQTSIPENMVITDKESDTISGIPDLSSYDAIAIGPGLGKSPKAMNALQALLEKTKVPLVIDADALNLLSENKELLKKIPAGSILTPHPKEFERLAGKSADDYIKLEMLRSFAMYIKSCVVLKGAHTAVCTPEGKIYFNSTGNPGMATGGSGDVLTGIITSLLAQGYSSEHAAILGVYLHGYAGDVAAMAFSEQAMMASDILDGIGEFFKQLN
jgi:ADP-dependent NAD(P)H-hydrate dehydratase / NAD(P)H-hydrate epimerase